jgi:hypothetical protein
MRGIFKNFVLFSLLLMLPLRGMAADMLTFSAPSHHDHNQSAKVTHYHEGMASTVACHPVSDSGSCCQNDHPSKGSHSCCNCGDCCTSALLEFYVNRTTYDSYRSPYNLTFSGQPYPGFIPEGPERPPKISSLG